MRTALGNLQAQSPRDLAESLRLLAEHPDWRPLAGGTDIMVELNTGVVKSTGYVDLSRVDELKLIEKRGAQLVLGARSTFTDCLESAQAKKIIPNLLAAAAQTGGKQVQNAGTLGGNVANASPAADAVATLLAADAQIELHSVRGVRQLALKDFYTGYRQTARKPDELIAAIIIDAERPVTHQLFRKVGTRRAQAISKVVLAAEAALNGGKNIARIAISVGSVAPTPLRLFKTEQLLLGHVMSDALLEKALVSVDAEIHPIDDIRSTAAYRRRVTRNIIGRFFQSLA